jgi:hypothetical protein
MGAETSCYEKKKKKKKPWAHSDRYLSLQYVLLEIIHLSYEGTVRNAGVCANYPHSTRGLCSGLQKDLGGWEDCSSTGNSASKDAKKNWSLFPINFES